MKSAKSFWPILIISGQFNAQNDEGFRLREVEKELRDVLRCNVIPAFSYEDGHEVFLSRADFGCIVVDWDIPAETTEEKMKPIDIVRLMRELSLIHI